jgi:hypothetical protein
MANPEHLAKLKEGVEAWNQWRWSNPSVKPDLIRAKLSGAGLSGANLAIRILMKSLSEKRLLQATVILLWSMSKSELKDTAIPSAIDLVRTRVKRNWNFCDELRALKENPGTSFDSMLLKDLGIVTRDLMDATQYEGLFKATYGFAVIDPQTRQFADRTLRGIEGEKNRLAQFRQSRNPSA